MTVGGSGVGSHLIRRILQSYPLAAEKMAGLRMIVVAGPGIDPGAFAAPRGVELRSFVPDLDRHLAACDLALVQGGLTTCMELTAARDTRERCASHQAFVWVGPSMTRNDAYVAFSRARDHLESFADLREIDTQARLDLPLSERLQATITPEQRLEWLAARLSCLQVKTCRPDPMFDHAVRVNERLPERGLATEYERS
ncbi:hypothetical protein ABID62_008956 [Bradyrhizobium sp. S3.9.1]